MIVKIYPENPNPRQVDGVVQCLRQGGVIIYPTDTLYGIGCNLYDRKAIERIAAIKGITVEKANFSFICPDLSRLAEYARQVPNAVFKVMKHCLPGPFTFILNASNKVPKMLESPKKTVGIRVPDNSIALAIVEELGAPLVSTSVRFNPDSIEDTINPELIHEHYETLVDMVIDGGDGGIEPSTVVDCTDSEPVVVRQGLGILF
jgi:tRNA threonylcarbamoyl adenosine modification protein (Sua5/YciO/YrdC/YwlC family)